ncbi:MAG: hypothetical protein RJB39_646 [Candidatus Parcubacteria bacterium]|jgi:hypothetical protein
MGEIIRVDFAAAAAEKNEKTPEPKPADDGLAELFPDTMEKFPTIIALMGIGGKMSKFFRSLRGFVQNRHTVQTLEGTIRTYDPKQVLALLKGTTEADWTKKPTYYSLLFNRIREFVQGLKGPR